MAYCAPVRSALDAFRQHKPDVTLMDLHRALEAGARGYLLKALSNKEIAGVLGRTEATIKVHVLHILQSSRLPIAPAR